MKKFVIFALAVLVAFAMCSCQPTAENLDGDVEFKVSVGAQASKSLIPSDPGQDAVSKVELAFLPLEQGSDYINCQYKIGNGETQNTRQSTLTDDEPSNWISGLITVTHDTTNHKVTLTWTEGAKLYLSQGKWTIYAQALDSSDKVLYEGDVTTYVNKKSATATITLTPKATTGTGTLVLDGLTATKVFEDETREQLAYTITSLNSSTLPTAPQSAGGTVISPCEDQDDAEDGEVVFNDVTIDTLTQGSYILSVVLQQDTSADDATSPTWTDFTGGSVTDFGIYEGKTTTITGHVDASDYMATTVGVKIENAVFTLSLTDDEVNGTVTDGKYTAKYTATITVDKTDAPNAVPKNILWFVDGRLKRAQALGSASSTGEYTDTLSTLEVAHGKHNIQAIVTGSITGGNTVDAKSNLVTKVLDTRSKL